jgi:hypothetical protein
MKKNLNELNPTLKKDDRVILIHMSDYSVPTGSKGLVMGITPLPKFSENDPDFGYLMKWFDDEGKQIGSYNLIPIDDAWLYDREYYETNSDSLNEVNHKDLDDLIRYTELLAVLPKPKMKIVQTYLELIRQLGIVNMFESVNFLGITRQYFEDYMRLKSYEKEYDEDLVEEITEMVDDVRNILISASINYLEDNEREVTVNAVSKQMVRIAKSCVRVFLEK